MMLSYGDFSITKKLFWCEKDQAYLLPIFTDSEIASKFIDEMQKILDDSSSDVKLQVQVCDDAKNAVAILTTIATILPSLRTIILNPILDNMNSNMISIDETIDSLQTSLSGSGDMSCDSEKHL